MKTSSPLLSSPLLSSPLLSVAAASLLFASTASAAITYVDATDQNTFLATDVDQTVDPSTWINYVTGSSANGTKWNYRTTYGNGGGIFVSGDSTSGSTNAPTLVTLITGLVAGETYDISVYYWVILNTANDWRVAAGLADDSLTTYTKSNGTLMAATSGTSEVTETNSTDFTSGVLVSEGNRRLYQGSLGEFVADSNGVIAVYIDDSSSTAAERRVWYDGVGYSPVVIPEPSTYALAGGVLALSVALVARRRRKS